ncbi:MAG: hypothetical protein ACI86H_001708 [bacterium]|jgi:uncharacterized protein (TIGR02285 family)
MTLRVKIWISILLIFNVYPTTVQGKPEVQWFAINWMPAMKIVSKNPVKLGGFHGNLLHMITKEMPDYKHHYVVMNWRRFWFSVQRQYPICNSLSLNSMNRSGTAIFSLPTHIAFSPQIIMLKFTYKKLGRPKSLSLKSIIQNKSLHGILIKGRSYTKKIDQILKQNHNNSNIDYHVISEKSYLWMLLLKRMDYIIEYPVGIHYNVKRLFPKHVGKLAQVRIKEINPYVSVRIACPKNDWGKKVICSANQALKKLYHTKRYQNTYKQLYKKKDLQKILTYHQKHFSQQNQKDSSFCKKLNS